VNFFIEKSASRFFCLQIHKNKSDASNIKSHEVDAQFNTNYNTSMTVYLTQPKRHLIHLLSKTETNSNHGFFTLGLNSHTILSPVCADHQYEYNKLSSYMQVTFQQMSLLLDDCIIVFVDER